MQRPLLLNQVRENRCYVAEIHREAAARRHVLHLHVLCECLDHRGADILGDPALRICCVVDFLKMQHDGGVLSVIVTSTRRRPLPSASTVLVQVIVYGSSTAMGSS
jgi:hypothetical protein